MRTRLRSNRVVALIALVVVAAVAGGVALVVPAEPAAAHAQLLETRPAHGEVVDSAPEQVLLRFNEQVEAPGDAVEVLDGSGDAVDIDEVQASGTDLTAALPELEEGAYVVSWRVVSADSHPVDGAFLFRVGAEPAEGDEDADALLDEVLAGGGGDEVVGFTYGVARFVVFFGLTLVVGSLLFMLLSWPGGAVPAAASGDGPSGGAGLARLRRLMVLGWWLVLVATVASFGLQGAYGAGGSWADTVDPERWGDVLGSRAGQAWLVRLVLLAGLALADRWFFRPARGREPAPLRPTGLYVGAGVGVALVATVSAAGHAASGPWVGAAFVADVAHMAGAMFWLGGLALLFLVVLPGLTGQAGRAAEVARRFSPQAATAVVVVVATGVFQGWRQLGGVGTLFGSTYGRVLVVKVGLVGLILLAALLSRRVVQGWGDGSPQVLRRTVGAEAAVGAAVLAVTAVLVNTMPGRDDTGEPEPVETVIHGQHGALEVRVDPLTVGTTDIELAVLTHLLQPMEAEELTATLSHEEQDVSRLPVDVEPGAGEGTYAAEDVDLPFDGLWELEVVVRVSDIDQDRLIVELPVE